MDRFTIEPHGDAYALYFGRSNEQHGHNLCRIDDLAHNCDLKALEALLNAGMIQNRITDNCRRVEENLKTLGLPEKESRIARAVISAYWPDMGDGND